MTERHESERQRGRRGRDTGALAFAVAGWLLVAGALGGCGSTSTAAQPTHEATPQATATPQLPVTPRVGDCWSEPDYGVVVTWSWWQGPAAVDCALEHNSITIAVGELPEDFAYEPVDGRLELSDAQLGTVANICQPPEWQGIGLTEGSRVTSFFYVPTPEEWAVGARWVRCDIVLVAYGPLSPMTLEPLPPTADELRPGVADYRLCLDTAHPAIVYGPWYDPDGNVAVECAGEAQWEFAVRVQLPDGPYPGEDVVRAAGEQPCQQALDSRAGDRWGGHLDYPDEQGWAEGGRSVRCWLR